jgi:hypothetical protein
MPLLRFLEENTITEDRLSTDDRNYTCVWENFRNEKLIDGIPQTHMQEVKKWSGSSIWCVMGRHHYA